TGLQQGVTQGGLRLKEFGVQMHRRLEFGDRVGELILNRQGVAKIDMSTRIVWTKGKVLPKARHGLVQPPKGRQRNSKMAVNTGALRIDVKCFPIRFDCFFVPVERAQRVAERAEAPRRLRHALNGGPEVLDRIGRPTQVGQGVSHSQIRKSILRIESKGLL